MSEIYWTISNRSNPCVANGTSEQNGGSSIGIMSGTNSNKNNTDTGYNDAFQMVPTHGKLMRSVSYLILCSIALNQRPLRRKCKTKV